MPKYMENRENRVVTFRDCLNSFAAVMMEKYGKVPQWPEEILNLCQALMDKGHGAVGLYSWFKDCYFEEPLKIRCPSKLVASELRSRYGPAVEEYLGDKVQFRGPKNDL